MRNIFIIVLSLLSNGHTETALAQAADTRHKANTQLSDSDARQNAWIVMGDSCMDAFNLFQALQCYEKAYAITPTRNVMSKLGECYYKRGAYLQCTDILEKLDEQQEEGEKLGLKDMRTLYYSYAKLEKRKNRDKWGNRIVENYPYDAALLSDYARRLNAENRPETAHAFLANYYQKDSTDMHITLQLADASFLMLNFNNAKKLYQRIIKAGDVSFDVSYSLGMCFFQEEKWDSAYYYLLRAAEINSYKNVGCLYRLGLSAVRKGAPAEGIRCLNIAIQEANPSPKLMIHLHETLADAYEKKGDSRNQLETLKECLQYDGNNMQIYYKLAQAYQSIGDKENARHHYNSFLGLARMISERDRSDDLKQVVKIAEYEVSRLK